MSAEPPGNKFSGGFLLFKIQEGDTMQYKILISILFLLVLLAIITGCGQGDSVHFNTSNEENALGQVTLAWDVPTTYDDGSPLNVSDLAGYKIYYGPASGNYTSTITAGNMSVTSEQVTNLTKGQTYYLAVTAYDIYGIESGYSNEVRKIAD